ncbi:MAG: proline dehydrogenase family protein [bacterium]|jgi:proline dehydrogenase
MKNLIISVLTNPFLKSISQNKNIKKLAFKYVASEDLQSTIDIIKELILKNFLITVSFLGEHFETKEKVEEYLIEIYNLVKAINDNELSKNVSISLKLSSLGLLFDFNYTIDNLVKILDMANNIRIHIDMEDTKLIDDTFRIFDIIRYEKGYLNLDITLQAYLYRTDRDLNDKILSKQQTNNLLIRLCKGAYKESYEKVFPNKKGIDENYLKLAMKLIDNVDKVYPAFATHDFNIIKKIQNYAHLKGIGYDKFEFQMLYGVLPKLQNKLISEGYRLRLYLPYGKNWYDYIVRRIAEKPSNIFYVIFLLFTKKKK